ncbi:Tfp pilus assembly protein PilF [Aliiruegeria haliotis]|uniref:Tfp pilus assembly protein PilF n=1 Tax=Aliiruegeria haliotis TaxID=1280846 RepID=A0A2T0S0J0_9RHOB|nr:hypothetical protein [Aliiruegeria haliotis]PRY26946.1 Tfp pilus assembly protein PilF [Aliiruegeria haliotis]
MTEIGSQAELSPEDRKAALESILASPVFEGAGRLRDFLVYIVDEEAAGRGDAIRGKTIAQDVYGRTSEDGPDPENIVRVDARRLRQMLEHFYATDGADAPVKLHLDTGTYCPRFEALPEPAARRWSGLRTRFPAYVGLFVLGTLVGIGIKSILLPEQPVEHVANSEASLDLSTQVAADRKVAERTALMDKSPASLEAIHLAEQGRRMFFPIFDAPRQELLSLVFERVIELDPDYFGGYAGLAHALATRAILSSDVDNREALVAQATASARKAVRLAPTQAWTQSSLAWVTFAAKDYDEAMRLAELSARLDPDNGQILDILGSVALFAGNFERAVEAANGGEARVGANQRFVNRNIFSAASFHLGNYRDASEGFAAAAASGDPLSAPSLAYQAAAFAALGREQDAKRKLTELERAWPDAPLGAMLYGIHRDKADADAVLDRLRDLGWTDG